MATKQEKAVQRALKKERKQTKIRGEKHVLWLLTVLILLLLYLLFAQHYAWWPYSRANLGTAFYTNVNATAPMPAAGLTTSSSSTNAGTTGSQGGGSGSSSSGSGTTPTTPSTPANPSIAGFSAGVNIGDTKAQTSTQANGLGQNCAVVANATASVGGQQEVCVYTQGDKIVTVTYLNGHVISASKSGF